MMGKDTFAEISRIIGEILDLEESEIAPDSCLESDLGAESIDLLELAAALNARFGIEVNEEDLFLKGFKNRPDAFPYLTEERRRALGAQIRSELAVEVADLVDYIDWKLARKDHDVP